MENRLVSCPECGRAFPDESALERHRETEHQADENGWAPDENVSIAGNQDAFPCADCGKSFQSQQLLDWHRQGVHGPSGPPPSPRDSTELSRSSSRKIGCALYSVLFLGFVVAGLVFHWDAALLIAGAIGIGVIYVITLVLDERESDWKETTKAEFREKYETPPRYVEKTSPPVLTELSTEQISRVPVFVEKWRRTALETGPADRASAEKAIVAVYHTLGLSAPKIVWCSSPLAAGLARAITQRLRSHAETDDGNPVWNMALKRVKEQMSQEFWDRLRLSVDESWVNDIGACLSSRLRTDFPDQDVFLTGRRAEENSWNVAGHLIRSACGQGTFRTARDLLYPRLQRPSFPDVTTCLVSVLAGAVETTKSEVKRDERRAAESDFAYTGEVIVTDVSSPDQTRYEREKVKDRVRYTVGERPEDSIGSSVAASARNSCYGQDDAAYLLAFDYFRLSCGLTEATDGLKGQCMAAQAAGWYLPHQNICWVSERHSGLHLSVDGRLHCENGRAIEYPDGWGVYVLNGVVMEPRHVLTPAERLDPREIVKEPNVDVRRELIRKAGITRLLDYGKEVDRQGNYRLVDMSPVFKGSGIRYAPYLLMDSASLAATQHLEGVSPECRTVEQAINWRASEVAKTWKPLQLS
jgi:hypothetical protein